MDEELGKERDLIKEEAKGMEHPKDKKMDHHSPSLILLR